MTPLTASLNIFRTHPLITRFFAIVLLPALALSIWLLVTLRATIPEQRTALIDERLSAPAFIIRDAHGVPQVRAASDRDAFFAIGYTHAQDRLWQLEIQRRIVRGRLSEVFGKGSVDDDVWFRTLGLHDGASSAWRSLSADARESLTAYAEGVNAWIARAGTLPIEFRIFGIRPEPWTELDSLAWIKVFALDLGGNYSREMSRSVMAQALSEEQLTAFFPEYPTDAPTTVRQNSERRHDFAGLMELQQRLDGSLLRARPYTGSNAWAVAGQHTEDGSALLANDPHLALQIPSQWYTVAITTPSRQAAGMTLVGLPLIIFGHNQHISWAGTNMMADTQDLFLEQPDASGDRYRVGEGWEQFTTRKEKIVVRADFPSSLRAQLAPLTLNVRSTRHGPVISDYFGVFEAPVALRWTGLDRDDTSYEAFYRLNYARDWETFKAALRFHVAPAMNMLYADQLGRIGYLGVGRIPVRGKGEGSAPSPGWDPAFGWTGHVAPELWPQQFNPASGYIVNANNRIVDDTYPYFISNDWASPARAQRIEQMLEQQLATGRKLTTDDMARMQADTLDLEAASLAKELSKVPAGDDPHAATAASYLRSWDGDMRGSTQAAAIFHVWMRHFRHALFDDQLRGNWNKQRSSRLMRGASNGVRLAYLLDVITRNDSVWCDDVTTPAHEACDEILRKARTSALWELHKLKGDWGMQSWRWNDIQNTHYAHVPFSRWKPFARIFERRVGNGGSRDSINVASGDFAGSEGYLQNFGAGFRQIIRLGPTGARTLYMNSTGQSGNIMSRHYDDMVEPFRDVRYYELDVAPAQPLTAATGERE